MELCSEGRDWTEKGIYDSIVEHESSLRAGLLKRSQRRARGAWHSFAAPVFSHSASSRIIHEKNKGEERWGKRGTKIAHRGTTQIDKQPEHNGIKRRASFFGNFNNVVHVTHVTHVFLPAHYVPYTFDRFVADELVYRAFLADFFPLLLTSNRTNDWLKQWETA